MPQFSTTRHVPHSATDMFDLVADVKSYPRFVPLCESLVVRSRRREEGREILIATMAIAYKMIRESFTTRVVLDREAMTIRADLTDSRAFPAKYSNTCWSLIETDDGVKVGAQYEPQDGKITSVGSFISQTGEDSGVRKATYEESIGWYDGIVADMFG